MMLQPRRQSSSGISSVFPWFVVHWHSDLNLPCSSLSVDKVFYLKNTCLELLLFHKIYQLLKKCDFVW
jgi:hypothetical protein